MIAHVAVHTLVTMTIRYVGFAVSLTQLMIMIAHVAAGGRTGNSAGVPQDAAQVLMM